MRVLDEKCCKLAMLNDKLALAQAELEKAEYETEKKTEESKLLAEIAKLRGENIEEELETEELMLLKKNISEVESSINKFNDEILNDLKIITFDIPIEIPLISNNNSVIKFENGPYHHIINHLGNLLNMDNDVEIDNSILKREEIIIRNVNNPLEVIEELKQLKNNISRMASIKLNEQDDEVEEVVEFFYNSKNKEIWEYIGDNMSISYDNLFKEYNYNEEKDKKKIRNYFTNLDINLKEKSPYIRVAPGIYNKSFFGQLVWNRYKEKYGIVDSIDISIKNDKEEEKDNGDNIKRQKKLNNYNNEDIKNIIYGRKIK